MLPLARSSGQNISTMTCMVRAIDGRFLRSLHLRSTGMDVMLEMIHKAKLLRATIEEVPADLGRDVGCFVCQWLSVFLGGVDGLGCQLGLLFGGRQQ